MSNAEKAPVAETPILWQDIPENVRPILTDLAYQIRAVFELRRGRVDPYGKPSYTVSKDASGADLYRGVVQFKVTDQAEQSDIRTGRMYAYRKNATGKRFVGSETGSGFSIESKKTPEQEPVPLLDR